jgi:hypothetical protein
MNDDILSQCEKRVRYLVDLVGDNAKDVDLLLHEVEALTEQEARALLVPAVLLLWQHRLAPGPSL